MKVLRSCRRRMFLLILSLALLLTSVAATSAGAQATPTKIKRSDSFPFSFFNNCTGEVVSGVVNVKTTIIQTVDANGGFHFHLHDVFHGRAVGETTGTQYVGPQTDHDGTVASSNGGFEATFTENFRFLSRGSADNVLSHILFHITVTPNGDVTTEFVITTDVCRG